MAFFGTTSPIIELEFDITNSDSRFSIKNGMLTIKGDIKEIVQNNEYIHELIDPEMAIKNMPAESLEKLRLLIAPEVEKLNFELERQIQASNIEAWNRFNSLRELFQKDTKKLTDTLNISRDEYRNQSEAMTSSYQSHVVELAAKDTEIRYLKSKVDELQEVLSHVLSKCIASDGLNEYLTELDQVIIEALL